MNETKHTPGPWGILDVDLYKTMRAEVGYHTEGEQWVPIASITGCGPYERDANARLIAAAPEMLEALKLACLVMAKGDGLSYHDRREAHEACQAALIKTQMG